MADFNSRRDFEAQIVAKAWKDESFRNELKANPKAVLERELKALYPDAALPADLEVKVVEESAQLLPLCLPGARAGIRADGQPCAGQPYPMGRTTGGSTSRMANTVAGGVLSSKSCGFGKETRGPQGSGSALPLRVRAC